ncbi:MAG TPA: M55 family metallopeptidase [Savagea sp.]
MKVYIIADGEGISGVVSSDEMHESGSRFEEFRELMTMDVNAAIEGAFQGGATEVVVNDAHWSMLNLIYKDLDPRAEIIRGGAKKLSMVEQVEGNDLVFMVGLHAKVGHSDGLANETMMGPEMYEMRMNGEPVGELELNAAIAGHFGIPVGMVSGDDYLAQDAKASLGDVEAAVVKKAINRFCARCLSLPTSHALITQHAKRAVERAADFQPYVVEGEVELEIEWTSTQECYRASFVPGSYRKNARTIAYKGATILEAWEGIFACLIMGSTGYDAIYG